MEPQIQYARRPDGVRTAYAVMGSGPVLVVPPGVETSLDWLLGDTPAQERFWARLAEHRTVVNYDRHGCGLSDRSRTDFTSEDDMLDLDAVLEALGNPIVDFFGISWGGNPVLAYAARHPDRVRRLVLYGAFASGRAGAGEKFEARQAALKALRRSDRELYTKAKASEFFPSGADREMFQSLARVLFESTSPEMGEQLSDVNFDNQSVLGQITAPTLVIHRRGDQACLFEWGQYMARRMRNARFLPLDGDAHFPWVDDAESVLRPAIEFFTEAEESEAAQPPYSAAATARLTAVAPLTFAAGRYTVTRLLGEGAQKIVYLVHDAALERDCALALLKTEVLDADSLARVRREGQAMARLTHPNIVTVHDIGDEDGRPYLVCEFVPGGDLRQELDKANGSLLLNRGLAIAGDVCRALAFAHSQGIIHRDVKPGNVHLARDGSAKLGDFGLALAADQSRLTMPGMAVGTAPYMAPEQARGQPGDARTDLYSLGCLLYELITGRPPFTGDDPMAVVSQHVHAQPEPPSQHNANVSGDLEQLVLSLLAKAREERPSSADEALAELKRIAAES